MPAVLRKPRNPRFLGKYPKGTKGHKRATKGQKDQKDPRDKEIRSCNNPSIPAAGWNVDGQLLIKRTLKTHPYCELPSSFRYASLLKKLRTIMVGLGHQRDLE